jgi:membrane-associated protease RseP (regulator of RpoE activity)
MLAMLALLILNIVLLLQLPQAIAAKAPPVLPFVPYAPQIFQVPGLPDFYFTQWIIIIIALAITHEFAHGIFAKLNGIKLKSTGFGFLGPIMLAFVEPDDKAMARKSKKAQLSVLSAGTFSNFVFGILFIILFLLFFNLSVAPSGILYAGTIINSSQISSISINNNYFTQENISLIQNISSNSLPDKIFLKTENGSYLLSKELFAEQSVYIATPENNTIVVYYDSPAINANIQGEILKLNNESVFSKDIIADFKKIVPYQQVTVETTKGTYELTATIHPQNSSRGFIGLAYSSALADKTSTIAKIQQVLSPVKNPFMQYSPRYNSEVYSFVSMLFFWLIMAFLGMAFFNMLPFAFMDGGRFFMLSMWAITKSKKKGEKAYKIASLIVLIILGIMVLIWLARWLLKI